MANPTQNGDPSGKGQEQSQERTETLSPRALLLQQLNEALPGKTARPDLEPLIDILVREALADTTLISEDALATIEALIAGVDSRLSAQVNQILHAPKFQKLEGTWRGLERLVANTNTSADLRIQVLNVSKDELGRSMKQFKGKAFMRSPLFKQIYRPYDSLGGDPIACIVGDYEFDHSASDTKLLGRVARVAAAAKAPFISAAAPSLVGLESWSDYGRVDDLGLVFSADEYAEWKALRKAEDSRFLGLTLPRYISRLPWDPEETEQDGFAFVEEVEGQDDSKYTWSNSAYLMAEGVTQAFDDYRWCTAIVGPEFGGTRPDLPSPNYRNEQGTIEKKYSVEVAMSGAEDAALNKQGLIPLTHRMGANEAVFMGAHSLEEPEVFLDPASQESAKLSARLPYTFAVSRFAHFLKAMVREQIGSPKEGEELTTWLNNWIQQFVCPAPELASTAVKAAQPLAWAKIEVEPVEGQPGVYNARVFLRPHYLLEEVDISIGLTGLRQGEER